MDDAVEISQAIKRGNEFFRKIMTWDTKKTSVTRSNLEKLLNDFLAQFVRTIDADLSASLSFGDVHSKMNRKWHTELAYVEVANYRCHLLFDNTLAEQTDPHAGLIFIAKSWVLLFVLVKALSLDPNLQGSFVFEIGDNATLGEVGFSSSHPDACLILDYDFAASNGYEAYRQICDSQMIPWTQRLSKIFWRGSTTGRRLFPAPSAGQPDDFQWLSRLALCKACSEDGLAEICDVGITQLQQVSEQHLQARIAAAGS